MLRSATVGDDETQLRNAIKEVGPLEPVVSCHICVLIGGSNYEAFF